MVTLPRGSRKQFDIIVNDGADTAGIVWSVSNTAYAVVDKKGLVSVMNIVGMAVLTVKDTVSGISHVVVLRIT
jgi:hypothetical protein